MNTFLIGYDLDKPGQDYSGLIARLKFFSLWWHHLDSTWIVKSNLDAAEIRDDLQKYIDTNDELFVVDITGDSAAWAGFNSQGSNWLLNNI